MIKQSPEYFKDLVGRTYGSLTVTKYLGKQTYHFYEVKCKCGTKEKVMREFIIQKKRTCLNCLKKEQRAERDAHAESFVGTQVGKLLVEKFVGRSKVGHLCYIVLCECGRRERTEKNQLTTSKRSCVKCHNKRQSKYYHRLVHHLLNNLDTDVEVA
jgi:hypothetical protein